MIIVPPLRYSGRSIFGPAARFFRDTREIPGIAARDGIRPELTIGGSEYGPVHTSTFFRLAPEEQDAVLQFIAYPKTMEDIFRAHSEDRLGAVVDSYLRNAEGEHMLARAFKVDDPWNLPRLGEHIRAHYDLVNRAASHPLPTDYIGRKFLQSEADKQFAMECRVQYPSNRFLEMRNSILGARSESTPAAFQEISTPDWVKDGAYRDVAVEVSASKGQPGLFVPAKPAAHAALILPSNSTYTVTGVDRGVSPDRHFSFIAKLTSPIR